MTWYEAMVLAKKSRFLGKNDWRLPTKGEYMAVAGPWERCKDNEYTRRQFAVSSSIFGSRPEMSYRNHHEGYWTISSYNDNGFVKIARLGRGYDDDDSACRECSQLLGLVRETNEIKSVEFIREYGKIDQYLHQEAARAERVARERREFQEHSQVQQQWSVLGRTVGKYGMAGHRQETYTISCSSQKLRTVYHYVTGDWANETPYEDIYSNRRFPTLEQAAANSCRQ